MRGIGWRCSRARRWSGTGRSGRCEPSSLRWIGCWTGCASRTGRGAAGGSDGWRPGWGPRREREERGQGEPRRRAARRARAGRRLRRDRAGGPGCAGCGRRREPGAVRAAPRSVDREEGNVSAALVIYVVEDDGGTDAEERCALLIAESSEQRAIA